MKMKVSNGRTVSSSYNFNVRFILIFVGSLVSFASFPPNTSVVITVRGRVDGFITTHVHHVRLVEPWTRSQNYNDAVF